MRLMREQIVDTGGPPDLHRRAYPAHGSQTCVEQHREGIQRCEACGGEVIVGRTVDGVLVELTVVLGERHVCIDTRHREGRP